MTDSAANVAQREYWNAAAGHSWAQFQQLLDRQIEPLGAEALRVLAPKAGDRILDIGCGRGQTTLDLAARVGPQGSVAGVDISVPMLDVARRRILPPASAPIEFRQIDAQTGDLGRAVFDAAFSRFGVMFFSDPVAAFANIRAALKPGGQLGFVCWRPLQDNPWMLVPLAAALPFLPPLPPPDPLAPGPFAFADRDRLARILSEAGFASVTIAPFETAIGGADLEQTRRLTFRVGPLAAALREHPDCIDKVTGAIHRVLADHLTPEGVFMDAAVWIVTAK